MMKARTYGEKTFGIFNYILMAFLSFITLYPFWNQFCLSLSGPSPVKLNKVFFVPLSMQIDAYRYLSDSGLFWQGFKFTGFITIVGTAFSIFMTVIFAYPLAKKNFRWRGPLTTMILITMFFSGGLIPEYLLYKQLHLIDNVLVYIIPGAMSTWNILILRNFFQGIPSEIEESALIDGANEFDVLMRIIVPMSIPAILTITLWNIVSRWNTFSQCIYFTTSQELRTIQVDLRNVVLGNNVQEGYAYISPTYSKMTKQSITAAAIVMTTMPMLIIYPFIQKYFVKGVVIGSLKG